MKILRVSKIELVRTGRASGLINVLVCWILTDLWIRGPKNTKPQPAKITSLKLKSADPQLNHDFHSFIECTK